MIADNPGNNVVIGGGQAPLGFTSLSNTCHPLGIARSGTIGHITWHDDEHYRTEHNYSVKSVDDSRCKNRYLYHVLKCMHPEVCSLATFDSIPRLNIYRLYKLIVPIPVPSFQKSIIIALDIWEGLIDELNSQIDRLVDVLRQLKSVKEFNIYTDDLFRLIDLERHKLECLLSEVRSMIFWPFLKDLPP